MPRGVYIRTEEYKRKQSESALGKKKSPRSKEHSAKLIESRRLNGTLSPSLEARSKISKSLTGRKMTYSEEAKQRLRDQRSEMMKKLWQNPEFRENQTARIVQQHFDGKMNTKSNWPTWTTYRDVNFRSKLESRVAAALDEADICWIYEPCRFKLSRTTYLPDFYLPEFDIYLEVKWYKQVGETNEKVIEFRSLGRSLVVVSNNCL